MRKNTSNTIYENISTDCVLLIGDIHGEFSALKDQIWRKQIDNCCLICVGDFGVGFATPNKQLKDLENLNAFFQKRNILFLSIAGNHDDPSYFNGSIDLSNLKLLPDYTMISINDERFLFVGGAVSIDRRLRVPNMTWWEGEEFRLIRPAVKKCDILITHSPPSWCGSFDKQGIESWCQRDATLWDECRKERLEIAELIKLCGAKKHYCGHMHTSFAIDFEECYSRILDINEIYEHK